MSKARLVYSAATLPDASVLEYADLGSPSGVPVIHHHGSPGTAGIAALADEAARQHGVRLVAVSRPGYGASSPTAPGLASVGRQVVALADSLGIDRFVTVGISGGVPFALATAAVAPAREQRVVVAAGTGPGLAERHPDEEGLALLAAGDITGAEAAMRAEVEEMIAGIRDLSEEELRDSMAARRPPTENYLANRPAQQAVFLRNFRRALATPDGFVRDNLSWGASWDIDPAAVTAPVVLLYGEEDGMVPAENGRLLAALIKRAELTVLPGAGHGAVTFGTADQVMQRFAES
jgi:pimeloyl-ACP methyl ester carboxylesterase